MRKIELPAVSSGFIFFVEEDKRNWPVVSIDTLDNNMVRFHDNPNAARAELSSLLGIKDLKPTRSFTQTYITGPTRNGKMTIPQQVVDRFEFNFEFN